MELGKMPLKYIEKIRHFSSKDIHWNKIRKVMFGRNGDGLVHHGTVYFLLVLIGFVFLYPLFYMISYSLMSIDDLISPYVTWIPNGLYLDNFKEAGKVLDYYPTLLQTLAATAIPSLVQTFSASLIGYGLARYRMPGKTLLLGLVLTSFIIPPQITMIPQFLLYKDLKIVGSLYSYILPAAFSQGIRSSIFVLIFYQFFRMIPKTMDEAAQIDGARAVRIFTTIAVPMAIPAYIISFLFSFVWYWNETTLAFLFFGDGGNTLLMRLQRFAIIYEKLRSADPNAKTGKSLNEAINMAGTLLTILPLLVVYAFTQHWFVESIDRTGITGE